MKKFIYILFAALLGVVSCTVNDPEIPGQEDGKVTLMMKVTFPEPIVSTKSSDMAIDPNIDNIYVATFGTEHYLNDYVQAIPCDEDGDPLSSYDGLQNGTDFYYKVTLNSTQTKRYVHVIANGPSAINYHDPEDDLMKTLTTTSPKGAYWTYFVLPNGTYDPDPVTGKNKAEDYFHNLKLIRNFARVTLSVASSVDNFTLTGYKVYNTPKQGSIAVFSEGKDSDLDGNPGYFPSYKDYTWKQLLSNYTAFMPVDDIDSDVPTSSSTYTDDSDKFIYERPDRQGDRPYIIMQGKFGDDEADTFYRLDFVDPEGNYLPILRNFEYKITLSAVTKSGVSDPSEARSSNTNVSALEETENLTDLSDGVSRIYVQWLDQAYMGADAGTKTFKYMYLRDATVTPQVSQQATLSILEGAGAAIEGTTADAAFTQSGPGADGWYTVTFTTTSGNGTSDVYTKFKVAGQTLSDPPQTLYRTITVHVLPTQQWGAHTASTSSGVINVSITLPGGLPPSLFPLEISFEDSAKLLNPNGNDMPAVIGPSIVPNNTNTSYQFVKTISYLDYQSNTTFVAKFKRINTGTGSTRLYFRNKYFQTTNNYVDIN